MRGHKILAGSDHRLPLFQTGQYQLPGFVGATHGFNRHIDIGGRDKLIPIGNRPGTGWNVFCFHA